MNKFLLLAGFFLILYSCKKDDKEKEVTTDFKLRSTNVYRDEEIVIGLAPQSGISYSVSFGDSAAISTAGNPKHKYSTPGIYNITVKAGRSSTTKRIRVFPGTASYQVLNKYPRTFNTFNSAAIDDNYLYAPTYQKSELAFDQITDTIFVQHALEPPSRMYITFNWRNPSLVNVQYRINAGFNLTKSAHKIFVLEGTTNGAFSGNGPLYYYNISGSISTADGFK